MIASLTQYQNLQNSERPEVANLTTLTSWRVMPLSLSQNLKLKLKIAKAIKKYVVRVVHKYRAFRIL